MSAERRRRHRYAIRWRSVPSRFPRHSRLGPGCVRNETMLRPLLAAECATRGRLSKNRCIQRRCRSIRVSFAASGPRAVNAQFCRHGAD